MIARVAFAVAAFLCCAVRSAFASNGAPGTTPALPPRTPAVTTVPGGSLAPHVADVRLTFVTTAGETEPSAEVSENVTAGALAAIDSPVVVSPVLGFNVYAAQESAGNRAFVLQNDAPIPIGTRYVEATSGFRAAGKRLADLGQLRTVENLPSLGAGIAAPKTANLSGNLVFSSNDGNGSVVDITSLGASNEGRRGLAFRFDRTVHFTEVPSFYFADAAIGSDDPALLELRDATEGRSIATLDKCEFGPLGFWGNPWHDGMSNAFVAIAGHTYEATLVTRPASMIALDTLVRQAYALPPTANFAMSVHVPPPSSGGTRLLVRTSTQAPIAAPPLAGSGVENVLGYVVLISRSIAVYDGKATADIRLPASYDRARAYEIAAYDPGFWHRGWNLGIMKARPGDDGTLSFSFDLRERTIYPRTYVFALYASNTGAGAAPQSAAPPAPSLTIVGDSTSLVTAVSPSAAGCPVDFAVPPTCQYLEEHGRNYASRAGVIAGYDVLNLSYVGAQATQDWERGQAAIDFEVQQIPARTTVVVLTCGLLDVAQNPLRDVSSRLDTITNAIRAFAPHARIVYVGVRYFNDSADVPAQRALVDAWDDRAALLGKRFGAFVDPRPLLPNGFSAMTPDGVHLTDAAQPILAQAVAAALVALK